MQNVKASGIELSDTRHSPKLMALKELLLDCGIGRDLTSSNNASEDVLTGSAVSPHRALIFCQMKQMLDIIENNLFKKQISVSYLRMDGSVDVSKRHDIVTKFNADPSIDVLLLTTQVGGLGLNLTGNTNILVLVISVLFRC